MCKLIELNIIICNELCMNENVQNILKLIVLTVIIPLTVKLFDCIFSNCIYL